MKKGSISISYDRTRKRWRVQVSKTVSPTGERIRSWFKTEEEAKQFKNKVEVEAINHGRSGTLLSPEVAADAARAAKILKPFGMTLTAAAKAVAAREKQRSKSVTLSELYEAYTENPKKPKRGATLQNYANTYKNFEAIFGQRPILDTLPSQIQSHLDTFGSNAAGNHYRALRAWFNYAVKRKWIAANPILDMEIDTVPQREIKTLTNEQVDALLAASSIEVEEDKDQGRSVAPYAVLATFCGIRPAELRRLDWSDVNLEDNYVTVTATSSKVKRRRVVTIPPAALPWLEPHARAGGTVVPYSATTFKRRWKAVREAAGVYDGWSSDVLRHTFCSAHIAYHCDFAKLQIETGHGSIATLRDHYLDAMPRKVALEFWRIVPQGAAKPDLFAAA